ncbi:MAG: hypothetical protein OEY59_10700 [Deltaproteobacteria bacterium]|nr:hypothetical protein [Deltaproteobacteria bacterium]
MINPIRTKRSRSGFKTVCALFLFGFILSGGFFSAFGDEPQTIRRSLRAIGMGNAFVAVANDESALYYNPAGLNQVKRYITEIVSINGTLNQTNIDLIKKGWEASKNKTDFDANAFIRDLVGAKLHSDIGLGLFSLTGPGWGYSIYASTYLDMTIHNPTVPYFNAVAFGQFNVHGGFALDFMDEVLDVGLGFKATGRVGAGKSLHIFEFVDAQQLQDDLIKDAEPVLAITPDIGVIYNYDRFFNYETKFAAVIRNIGGMDFGNTGKIPMSIDFGVSTETEQLGFDIIMAADWLDFTYATTERKSTKRNIKLGAEIGLWKRSNNHHALALRVGKNGVYSSWGWSMNVPLFPVMIDYAAWSEEVGAVAGSKEDKRQSLQLSFNF